MTFAIEMFSTSFESSEQQTEGEIKYSVQLFQVVVALESSD